MTCSLSFGAAAIDAMRPLVDRNRVPFRLAFKAITGRQASASKRAGGSGRKEGDHMGARSDEFYFERRHRRHPTFPAGRPEVKSHDYFREFG